MIEIELSSPQTLQLGEIFELHLRGQEPGVETRVLVKHEGIFYLRPLRDWSSEEYLLFFPEAPGHYTLVIQWRAGGSGEVEGGAVEGVREIEIDVGTRRASDFAPHQVQIDEEIRLWTPSEWEGRILKDAERATLDVLTSLVEPGAVVYDIGANLGLYAITLARRVGPRGRVYCLEANPICLQFLRANLALNEAANIEILPVAALDRSGTVGFTLNYGNSNLGAAEVSALYAVKSGHEIQVPAYEVDRLVEDFHLLPPAAIKIDIEGAECQAVRGMRGLLASARPILLLELHGEGNTRWTLEELDALEYRYADPLTREDFASAEDVVARHGDAVFQLLAFPRPA